MLDAIKVIFILTGASTYLVTKNIKVGLEKNSSELQYITEDEKQHTAVDEHLIVSEESRKSLQQASKSNTIKSLEVAKTNVDRNAISSSVTRTEGASSTTTPFKTSPKLTELENMGPRHGQLQDDTDSDALPFYEIEILEEEKESLPKLLMQMKILSNNTKRSFKPRYVIRGDGYNAINMSSNKFRLDEHSGQLFLISPLDRDLPNGQPQWKLFITIEDERNQHIANATMVIKLTDVNDNAPYFPIKHYKANITENQPIRQYVTRLTAIDNDDPHGKYGYGMVKYSIDINRVDKNGQLIFSINEQSGVLSTAVCCLDRESISEYVIRVMATDGGGLTDVATVSVAVLDENDESPKFSKPTWMLDLYTSRNYMLGECVLNMTVIDRDLPETNNFKYQIVNTSLPAKTQQYFSIRSSHDGSGAILIGPKFSLSAIKENQITNFTIQVTDNGFLVDPAHIDFATVILRFKSGKPRSGAGGSASDIAKVGTIMLKQNITLQSSQPQSLDSKPEFHFTSSAPTKPVIDSDPCDSSPCANGGSCVRHNNSHSRLYDKNNKNFHCNCAAGFYGAVCNLTSSIVMVHNEDKRVRNFAFAFIFDHKVFGSALVVASLALFLTCVIITICCCCCCKRRVFAVKQRQYDTVSENDGKKESSENNAKMEMSSRTVIDTGHEDDTEFGFYPSSLAMPNDASNQIFQIATISATECPFCFTDVHPNSA